MTILPPLINGKSYEFADITLSIMGTTIAGVTAISFSESMDEMQGVTGAGRDFVSYTNGKLKKEGSITLKYEEVANIEDVAPNGKLYDIPLFPITVTFTDATLVTRSYLITAKFKGLKLDVDDGKQTGVDVKLDLFVASIKKVA